MAKKTPFSAYLERFTPFFALSLCLLFFIAYSVLAVIRHNHYQSFGYDLGINNQVVWRYSQFQIPLSTSDPFPFEVKLTTHVELVYALIAPFYWIWSSARTLLVVEAGFICASGYAIYLLSKSRKLNSLLSLALVFGYLGFYGVQNAMWFDVHSAVFAAAFLAWFVYFLDGRQFVPTIIFCLLAITAKENIGLLTTLIAFIYFLKRRDKLSLILMMISFSYVLFIYLIYFPDIVHHKYLYENKAGLLSNLNPLSLVDAADKREAIFYTLFSYGFAPLLFPLFLLPALGDFATYFILASDLEASHGIFMHYRVTLAPLMSWATIATITRFKWLNSKYLAIYLVICTLLVQIMLHLPLSYLSKSWFWHEPTSVKYINQLKLELKPTDAVVAQNNILPHISQRDKIYSLYPIKKKFLTNSPCGQPECDWFHWDGLPLYLFVDTSPEWDARHLLTDRDTFLKALTNIEKAGIIQKYKQVGTAHLYYIVGTP